MEDVDPQLRRFARIVNLLLFLPLLSFASPVHQGQATVESSVDAIITFADEEVKHRLQSLDNGLVEHRFDPAVRSIIRRYVERSRTSSAIILGRATMYFPIFEAHLREAGLPEALKYLPIVESALRPEAVSRVGAQGLWQFMPATARGVGLVVDEYVDERIDPNRATEAALDYLKEQYDRFGDWALALAAYNAGQGNVQRAMRRSRRSSFWTLRRYLPGETANYVPGFIAATYLAEFYAHHAIEPIMPKLDRQLTETIKMHKPCSFYRIAQVTGLPIEEIEALNPGYRKGYIPGYAQGHYLVLPRRVMTAWRDYLTLFPYETEEPYFPYANLFLPYEAPDNGQAAYMSRTYTAHEGEPLHQAAEALSCSVYQLAVWNNLSPTDTLCDGQELRFYRPSIYKHIDLPATQPAVDELSARAPQTVSASSCIRETCLPVNPIAVNVAAPLRRERTTGLTIQFRSRSVQPAAATPLATQGTSRHNNRASLMSNAAANGRKALEPK